MTEPMAPSGPSEPTQAWNAVPAPQAGLSASAGPSGLLVTASVILFVAGALIGLVSIAFVFFGAAISSFESLYSQAGLSHDEYEAAITFGRIFLIVFGAIGLILTVAHVLSGIGILRRRGWARILGLVLGVLGMLIFVLGLIGNIVAAVAPIPAGVLQESGLTVEQYRSFARIGWIVGLGASSVGLLSYLVVVVVLASRGREFASG